jgi:hypothetical protein
LLPLCAWTTSFFFSFFFLTSLLPLCRSVMCRPVLRYTDLRVFDAYHCRCEYS